MNLPLRTLEKGQTTVKSGEQTPSVSVVICSRNRPALLQNCLAAVSRLDPAPNQVLVIDNSEGDNDTRNVAQEYGFRYTIEPVRGLSRARNRGLSECDSDIVAFLDDDASPEPDWLGQMLVPFADIRIGATTGRVITPDCQNSDAPQQNSRTLSNQDWRWFEIAAFGGLGTGTNMAFRKRALPIQRFFDERLGRGAPFEIAEENHAFACLLSRGYQIVHLPSAIVYHPRHGRTSIRNEARNSFAYWLLLFTEFPGQRRNILHFLIRRLRGTPLDWPRDSREPGDIVSSSWRVLFLAAIRGLWMFICTPKQSDFRCT